MDKEQLQGPLGIDWISEIRDHIQDTHLKTKIDQCADSLRGILGSSVFAASILDLVDLSFLHQQFGCMSGDLLTILHYQHWAVVKYAHRHNLTSASLQESFCYIENAPLLCILDDFLHDLNKFFLVNESLQASDSDGDVNAAYITALEVYCILRQRLCDMRYNWRNVVLLTFQSHGKFLGFVENNRHLVEATLEKLVNLSQQVLVSYCKNDPTPKFVNLSKKLELSDKEQDALAYILIQNVGVRFGKLHSRFTPATSSTSLGGSRQSSMVLAAANFAELTSKEMLEFFDENRKHLKQELLEPEDEFSTLHTSNFLKMPTPVLRACCGCSLSAEELYKIDKTAMAEVLSDADGATPAVPGGESEKSSIVVSDDEQEDIMTLEVEEILSSCDKHQSKAAEEMDVANNGEGPLLKSVPYESDLEYLEDNFQLIETLAKALKLEQSDDSLMFRADQRKPEAVIREMKAKARSLRAKIEKRMHSTVKHGGWLPRLERLAELRGLDSFEKNVLLILTGSMVSKNLRNTSNTSDFTLGRNLNIGMLIGLFCDGLQEQIKCRTYFYKNSKLVSEGLVLVSDPPLTSRGNFLDSVVELDRRLLDYIVGLDTEINELVDGSDLYTPDVTLDDVALPQDHRELLVNTFQSFVHFQKTCKELGLGTKGMSKGLCLLFYGPSGTGKTMTANAVANYLGKKVLLVTVSVITERDLTKELLRFLFREAKIHNAVLFFDECETLFESRENRSNSSLGVLLTEIEQYDGVIVLATNRHQDLDEAMHRRIQLSLPFSIPDYALRVEIWKSHVPASVIDEDIDWTDLALQHELTGGLICNAVLSALALALKECKDNAQLVLKEKYLSKGAKLQLKGLLEMVDFERRVIPTYGLKDLVLESDIVSELKTILHAGKTSKFIAAQWGFSGNDNVAHSSGIVCLICGESGTGKTAIAHALAYELGQPIKEANCTELLAHSVTINPRASRGVAAFFRDAQKANAIVVLDGVEILLSQVATSLMSGYVGCEHFTLAHQIEHFGGMVILTSRKDPGHLDLNKLPKLRHVVNLEIPQAECREQLWKLLVPQKAPVSSAIDYNELAKRFKFTGGDIARVICQAAEKCALVTAMTPCITQELLLKTAEQEVARKANRTTGFPDMFL